MKKYKEFGKLSVRARLITAFLRYRKKHTKDGPINLEKMRPETDKSMTKVYGRPLRNVKISPIKLTEYPAFFYEPENIIDDGWAILYLHGGGYFMGDININKGFVSRYANNVKMKIYSFDYPLAPENPYPAAVDATVAFYKKMMGLGIDPKKIIFSGDSAGGGLSLAVCHALKKAGIPLSGMLVLFSPWVDLTLSGETITTNKDTDLMITKALIKDASAFYAGEHDRKDPCISPLFGDFAGFPPVYFMAATDELFFSECDALHDALEKSDVDVYFTMWAKAHHAFIVGMHLFPESKRIMNSIRKFIYKRANIIDDKKE